MLFNAYYAEIITVIQCILSIQMHSTEEVGELVAMYAQAARNALEAGFDGVELHCANGYLVNQLISEHSNTRDDQYGGSMTNRLRFLKEVVAAVSEVVGADRLDVRFVPLFASTDNTRVYLGMVEVDPHHTCIEAIKMLEQASIAYLSITEAERVNTLFRSRSIYSLKVMGIYLLLVVLLLLIPIYLNV